MTSKVSDKISDVLSSDVVLNCLIKYKRLYIKFQLESIRRFQILLVRTVSSAVYLLLGALFVEAESLIL